METTKKVHVDKCGVLQKIIMTSVGLKPVCQRSKIFPAQLNTHSAEANVAGTENSSNDQ